MADGDHLDSMIELLAELVSRPSRASVDSPEPVLRSISGWLDAHGIAHAWLRNESGAPVGIWGAVSGALPGPYYVLNATADTAPFGDPGAWTHPPEKATIENGWLYGRGSADSKAGISVFCHVIADLARHRDRLAGKIGFLFDADEHTGTFGGIRSFMAARAGEPVAGMMIGYPGNDRIIVGARGFLRANISIYGRGAHSGSSGNGGINAIDRARLLLEQLAARPLPESDATFSLPPKLTATALHCGGDFSLVPDLCRLDLDIRLTPRFDDSAARRFVSEAIALLDAEGGVPPTRIEWRAGWPAYRLDLDHPVVRILTETAREAFGHEIPAAIAGPSNIANYLATEAIPATAGLGVTYRNIHAPDECVLLETLEPTFHAYREAVIRLLQPDRHSAREEQQ